MEFAGLLAANQLPVDDLPDLAASDCLIATEDGQMVGAIALQAFGDVALLRSLVVDDARRGHGTGERLVRAIETQAGERGIRALYLLTTTAETFFLRQGYVLASREEAPDAIRGTREFSSLCPASSSLMRKSLP